MKLRFRVHNTADIPLVFAHQSYHIIVLNQICVGTAEAIRGDANNEHAMTWLRHVSNDGAWGA